LGGLFIVAQVADALVVEVFYLFHRVPPFRAKNKGRYKHLRIWFRKMPVPAKLAFGSAHVVSGFVILAEFLRSRGSLTAGPFFFLLRDQLVQLVQGDHFCNVAGFAFPLETDAVTSVGKGDGLADWDSRLW
ncbi:MAG: hypothetical protein IKP68_01360, partial [Clostridia bacterium]|nr:hypothetical protein [Clostridia bacterium]